MKESQEYGSPREPVAENDRTIRQLYSIKSSMSFRLGNLLVKSIQRPWKILLLPISITWLMWSYVQERFGIKKIPETDFFIGNSEKNRNCIVLFPTNGVGMGHYARMYSLAMELKRQSPGVEIVFFTTNYVLHPLYGDGFTAYHLPNRRKFDGMDARTWNLQCEEMLANVFSVLGAPHRIAYATPSLLDANFLTHIFVYLVSPNSFLMNLRVLLQTREKTTRSCSQSFVNTLLENRIGA